MSVQRTREWDSDFICSQIADTTSNQWHREKLRQEWLIVSGFVWTPCASGRAAGWPLDWQDAGPESTGFSWHCHPAFLSCSAGSTLSGCPRAAGGLQRFSIPWSCGKEVVAEVRFLNRQPVEPGELKLLCFWAMQTNEKGPVRVELSKQGG